MTKRVGNIVMIYPEESQQCDECGKIDELRPYGKDGAKICWDCGQKNPRQTMRMMYLTLWDEEPTEQDYLDAGL